MTATTQSVTVPTGDHLPLRGSALAAGPTAVLSLALVLAVEAGGETTVEIAHSALGVAAGVAGLLGLIFLAFALVGLRQRTARLRKGAGFAGWTLAMFGTIMAAGGAWDQVFLLPGLATAAPEIADSGLDTVLAGYLTSYALLGLGWVLVAVSLIRAGTARAGAWVMLVGAVACLAPPLLGVRWFILAVGVSLVALHTARSDRLS
jgi:hypothetical protein